MDDSFLTRLGSQSSLWKMAGNLSSILDGTMPDLLETTINETQPFGKSLCRRPTAGHMFICKHLFILLICYSIGSTFLDISRIETEEFVRNEAVCATVADIIDALENNVSQHEERFRRPLDPKVDDFNDDGEDGDFESKCTKRIMNESIMSIGDPMTTESKKQKNQLDGSLMECFNENNENVRIFSLLLNITIFMFLFRPCRFRPTLVSVISFKRWKTRRTLTQKAPVRQVASFQAFKTLVIKPQH